MATKKKSKDIEEELIERANAKMQPHIREAGGKIADASVEENLEKFETEANPHVSGLKETMREGVKNMGLSLYSSVYFLLSAQLFLTFVLLLFLYVFAIVLDILLTLVILFIIIVYCISYCLISRYPQRFKRSSSCFLMCLVLAICEGLFLCFLSIPISTKVFLIEVSMIIFSLFATCIVAKIAKEKYSMSKGLASMWISSVIFFIIFIVSIEEYLWLTLCTVGVVLYEWFLVLTISKLVEKVGQEEDYDNFQGGLYVSLLIFKAKVDLFANVVYFIYEKCCKNKEKEQEI